MHIIAHRKNTIAELQATPPQYGVEIDLRTYGGRLILQHDPFTDAVPFEEWLQFFKHGPLVLNVKEDGLESTILALLKARNITNFFFLDQAMPTLIKTANAGEKRVALRFSEYEGLDTVLKLQGKVSWVWVDCFTAWPLDEASYTTLKTAGFKLCLVSPELQGRHDTKEITTMKRFLKQHNMMIDAVCTKKPDAWLAS